MPESLDFAQSKKEMSRQRNGQLCDITDETSSEVLAMEARYKPVLRIRICINFAQLDPDPGARRAKITHKDRKSEEISCSKVLDVLF
jgi:hypothetical protein